MSARRHRLVFAPEAQTDVGNVLAFTEHHWGKAQRHAYERLIVEAVDKIQQFPSLGRARPELGPDIGSVGVGQHVILYRATDIEITIVRILHSRRDVAGAFEGSPD